MPSDETHRAVPNHAQFLMGGAAGMAAQFLVQPSDLVKTRMQMSGVAGVRKTHKTAIHAFIHIIRKEGVFAVYDGLTASMLRQATYTTTRLGVFSLLTHSHKSEHGSVSFAMKCLFGMIAGGVGSVIGTPADLVMVRMTTDGRLPKSQQRSYKHVFDALYRVVKEEGVLSLWRGCGPTVARAVIANAAQLGTYSQVKQSLLTTCYFSDNILCHFIASMTSGVITTWASLPCDIIKVRIQSMKHVDGKPEYKNSIDALRVVIRKEGILSLWKGFTPCYFRLGPYTTLTFIFLEQFQKLARMYYGTDALLY